MAVFEALDVCNPEYSNLRIINKNYIRKISVHQFFFFQKVFVTRIHCMTDFHSSCKAGVHVVRNETRHQ